MSLVSALQATGLRHKGSRQRDMAQVIFPDCAEFLDDLRSSGVSARRTAAGTDS